MSWREIDVMEIKGEDGVQEEVEVIERDEASVIEEYVIEEVDLSSATKPPKSQKHARITPAQQEQMLQLQGDGYTTMQIANTMGLRRTTVHEALKRTNQMVKTNILKLRRMQKKRRKKAKKELLTGEQVDLVNQWLEEDSLMSMSAIVERLQVICGVTVSKSYIAKVIDDFTYSLKRLDMDPMATIKQDSNLVVARQSYAKQLIHLHQEYSEDQFVFVHFAEFTLVARTNATGEFSNERGLKRSLFNGIGCALNRKKVLLYNFQFMAMEEGEYRSFFQLLIKRLKEEEGLERAVIVLDEEKLGELRNEILQHIQKSGYRYLSLPKESEFLNPVERLFSGWKVISRRADAKDEKTLVKALEEAPTKLLTAEDCDHCYMSMLATLLPSLHGKSYDSQESTTVSFRPIKS